MFQKGVPLTKDDESVGNNGTFFFTLTVPKGCQIVNETIQIYLKNERGNCNEKN